MNMKEKKYLAPLILTFITSFFLFVLCYFPVIFRGIGVFSLFSLIFISEMVIAVSLLVTGLFKRDLHKIPNVLLLVYSALSALILLVMTSWKRNANLTMVDYIIILSILGGGLVAKIVFMLFWHNKYKTIGDVKFLGRRNYEIISLSFLSYLILIIAVTIFDNPDRISYVYLGELVIEGGTVLIALFCSIYAFSPLPISKDKKFITNVKDLIKSLQEKNVFFYVGVLFTLVLGVIALNSAMSAEGDTKQSYIALATFYFVMAIIKVVTF